MTIADREAASSGRERVHGRPLRVAYVTMQFPTPSETFAGTDVRTLVQAGVAVEVFSMRPAHRDHDELLRQRGLEGVRTQSLTAAKLLTGFAKVLSRPKWWTTLLAWTFKWHLRHPNALFRCLLLTPVAIEIFERIEEGDFDVVHLFWGHYPSLVGHLVQEFTPGIVSSVFLGAYDLQEDRYGSWVPGSVGVARRADFVWTHSRSNLERLHALGIAGPQVRCVYRGVDLGTFPSAAEVAAEGRVDGLLVSIGSLIERKAMDDVLRMVERVRQVVPEIRLRILGEGPEREALALEARALGIDDIVTFVGHARREAVIEELRRASAFVLLSRSDRIPNAVKEAMVCGCPCVVTNTQGMEELVHDGRTGYLVAVGDVEAAAMRVREILQAPHHHVDMVHAARRHVEAHFSATASMATYREAWQAARSARSAEAPARA